jgi:CRISPR-associated protein Cas5h
MRALRFELKGAAAFFKKPDVNSFAYFTYSHIHKVALFGMLGAILGLGGYMQQYEDNHPLTKANKKEKLVKVYPEFYDVFKLAHVSVVPHGDRGYFTKKIQIFNNSVGYASQEKGGTLNVREQWIENPHWTIYIAEDDGIDSLMFSKLTDHIMHSKAVYIPYLGKNDHPATILSPRIVEIENANRVIYVDSLFPGDHILCDAEGYIKDNQNRSFFKEIMPVGLHEFNNGYLYQPMVSTNYEIDDVSLLEEDYRNLYLDGNRVLYFN